MHRSNNPAFPKINKVETSQALSRAEVCWLLTDFLRREANHALLQRQHYWEDLYRITETIVSTDQEKENLVELMNMDTDPVSGVPVVAASPGTPDAFEHSSSDEEQPAAPPHKKDKDKNNSSKSKKELKEQRKAAKHAKKAAKKEEKAAKKQKKEEKKQKKQEKKQEKEAKKEEKESKKRERDSKKQEKDSKKRKRELDSGYV